KVNYEYTYKRILQQQAVVQHKQTELTELLFKTRSIVKESTNIGRTLVIIHLDVTDIFEGIMMSHQEYPRLHKYFDETGILNDYQQLSIELAKELDEVGIAVKSGEPSSLDSNLRQHLINTREKLGNLRQNFLKPDNIEGFISLSRILENIQDLSERLYTLQKYTLYDSSFKKRIITDTEYEKMISSQAVTTEIFIDNLTLKSDTFRHSLRMGIAVFAGFMVAQLFKIGHGYWILLTIIVILKPAFSLTKKETETELPVL
ncbi:MAG TPA: FUSC family membrane protein, partial [Segetibacter sp.]|nr:FUSC family membrane protein [Segetibacter sp.]